MITIYCALNNAITIVSGGYALLLLLAFYRNSKKLTISITCALFFSFIAVLRIQQLESDFNSNQKLLRGKVSITGVVKKITPHTLLNNHATVELQTKTIQTRKKLKTFLKMYQFFVLTMQQKI